MVVYSRKFKYLPIYPNNYSSTVVKSRVTTRCFIMKLPTFGDVMINDLGRFCVGTKLFRHEKNLNDINHIKVRKWFF